jgi:2-oxoglutarate ferredoxin oxidoreductase subunit alpha
MSRTVLKIAGESGMGLASVSDIIARALKEKGYFVHSDREYPSVIKGGHSNAQIDFSTQEIRCLSNKVDVVMALDPVGLVEYAKTVKEGGVVIHGYERHTMLRGLAKTLEERKIRTIYLPSRQIAHAQGGSELMINMVLLGALWRVLGLDLKPLEAEVTKRYGKRPKILEIDLKCVRAGYDAEGSKDWPHFEIPQPKAKLDKILLDGNMAIALGAIAGGVRAYYAYPMSPSSSILGYLGDFSKETGMVVKQAEDEITAAQMAAGSMYAGTRALVGTSGGGYDLMTETVSMCGIIENPLVIVIAQRPGPGTGLPTWTCQSDLALAVHAAHGEFPKVVIAASDPTSCYLLTQHALNLAEEFQTPAILLTEKVIAESRAMVDPFKSGAVEIKRGIVSDPAQLAALKPTDRYKITENGVSQRWLPGTSDAYYYANSDEHSESGVVTEDGEKAGKMYEKRMRKMTAIEAALPEPTVYGPEKADISFVCWGSTKNALLDAMDAGAKINFIHFEYLWPLKTERLKKFLKDNKKVVLIEGNYEGQLGNLIAQKTGHLFTEKLLKWNGRPFFFEEIIDYVTSHK